MRLKPALAFLFLFMLPTVICWAGDSTSIAPPGVTQNSEFTHGGGIDTGGGSVYTRSGLINTGGGLINTGGGQIYTGGATVDTQGGHVDTRGGTVYTPQIYGNYGMLNIGDHIQMNGKDIYDVGRVRAKNLLPVSNYDLATKYYVDQKGGPKILSGVANDGDYLPVPAGYTAADCHYIVSTRKTNDYVQGNSDDTLKWSGSEVTNRRVKINVSSRWGTLPGGTVNYLIICQ